MILHTKYMRQGHIKTWPDFTHLRKAAKTNDESDSSRTLLMNE